MSVQTKCHAISAEVIRLLRAERERRGLSKYTLSERSGLAQQTIGYVEREMRNPSFETILRIAEGLEVDLAEFIRRARKKSNLPAVIKPARIKTVKGSSRGKGIEPVSRSNR